MTLKFNSLKAISTRALVASVVALSLGAIATSSAMAQAVPFPDLSAGGTFTLNAGETTTQTATAAIADDALAVLNINGTWNSGGFEVQLGGVNGGNANQDVTLNIGSTGVVNWTSAWIAGGWPGNAVDAGIPGILMNFEEGGMLTFDGTGFGPRSNGGSGWSGNGTAASNGGGANAQTLYAYLWDQGFLQYEGSSEGSFGQNFTFTGAVNGAHTLTAQAAFDILGDFDGMNGIDIEDFYILSGNLAAEMDGDVTYNDGDIDFDGDIDLNDFSQFKALYPGGPGALAAALAGVAVPEPHTVGMLALASALLLTAGRARRTGR